MEWEKNLRLIERKQGEKGHLTQNMNTDSFNQVRKKKTILNTKFCDARKHCLRGLCI